MILLFNLNTYLGGGEVLLVRMAKELVRRGRECAVLCTEGSYIAGEIEKVGIPSIYWPIHNDSVVYMLKREKKEVADYIKEKLSVYDDLTVFTFCLRDTYNAIQFMKPINDGKIKLCMGIFHPDETKYISKLSIKKAEIQEINRKLLRELCAGKAMAFMNDRNLESCLPGSKVDEYRIIPLPIPLDTEYISQFKDMASKQDYGIIWIGRFVDFKYTGIMNIIKFVEKHPEFHLTMIGYGNYEDSIRKYIASHNITNVEIQGQITPEEIKDVVSGKDIGYATGTSILEIAQYGIPTVISPMIGPKMAEKYENKCVGVFGDTGNYNVGEVTAEDFDTLLPLDATMYDVINNYDEYVARGNEFIKEFALERVVTSYEEVWDNCQISLGEIAGNIPKPGLVKWLYKVLYFRMKKGKN